jgi:hypothetical protein
VITRAGDPDVAAPLAGFDVPPGASLTKVGDLAVAMSSAWEGDPQSPYGGAWWTTLAAWDMDEPLTPAERGTLVTAALPPVWGGYPGPADAECLGCYYGAAPRGTVVGEAAVAFFEPVTESEPAGERTWCTTLPPATAERETWYSGGISCWHDDGGPESCYGAIYACSGLDAECVSVPDPAAIGATTECKTEPLMRYWTRWIVHVVDLSDPDAPALIAPIELPVGEEGVSSIAVGDTLWVSTREPVAVDGDVRSYVRYWARAIDLSRPGAPSVAPRVNVPGELFAVDGADLWTRDDIYDDDHVESAIARCRLSDGVATLVARHRFTERQVQTALRDGAGHVLVSHGPVSWWYGWSDGGIAYPAVAPLSEPETYEARVTLLGEDDLGELATVGVDSWADLRWAGAGRALFQVPGGLLVMNTDDAADPWPQAFFATAGWPEELVVDSGRIWFAGGLYGLYAFDVDTYNLLPQGD